MRATHTVKCALFNYGMCHINVVMCMFIFTSTHGHGSRYTVVIYDVGGGETLELASTVTLTQPATLIATVTTVGTTCNGYSDGSVDLSVIGGTGPYT